MLYRSLLTSALSDRREDFLRFDRAWRGLVREYARRLRLLDDLSSEEVRRRADAQKTQGALPSNEFERAGSFVIPFGERWRTHDEARRWALEALHERVTFAADGSQLLPGREISMPVAAVQVAWFENPHTREGKYLKQARSVVVSPEELLQSANERVNAETIVGLHRFRLETEEVANFLERQRGWRERGARTPLAFFDGTLLISLALPKTRIQDAYVKELVKLVKLSRDTEVPLVGYVDQSYARDLVRLLDCLEPRPRNAEATLSLYDAQLLHAALENEPPVLEMWGERTAFCYSRREGFEDEQGEPLIGFTYLQTTKEGAPARLDVPAWIYEAGLLDEVLSAVRAECICGLGYPYAIETADAAAVITARDREHFLRALQEFASQHSFAFGVSRKAASKIRRR